MIEKLTRERVGESDRETVNLNERVSQSERDREGEREEERE